MAVGKQRPLMSRPRSGEAAAASHAPGNPWTRHGTGKSVWGGWREIGRGEWGRTSEGVCGIGPIS